MSNITVYANASVPISLGGENNTASNLNLHTYSNLMALAVGGGTVTVTDSIVATYANASYVLVCGVETDATWARTCLLNNIDIYGYNSNSMNHGLFMGYSNNSIIKNINLYGGGYGAVIKGNKNLLMENIYRSGDYKFLGFYIKAGYNNTFRNLELHSPSSILAAIYTATNPADGMNLTDITFENVSISGTNGSTHRITLQDAENTVLKDVIGYDILSISATGGTVDVMYSVDVAGTEDTTWTMTDNLSNLYGSYDVPYEDYVLSQRASYNNVTKYSPFTITATYGDTGETRIFNLIAPQSITFTFNELIPHIQGIKYAAFAGFGLIALAILTTIGFLFIKMFNDGFDTTSLIAVVIMAIGLAIVLFVGYIIISSVANGVTL